MSVQVATKLTYKDYGRFIQICNRENITPYRLTQVAILELMKRDAEGSPVKVKPAKSREQRMREILRR